jgi:hypothetical protein
LLSLAGLAYYCAGGGGSGGGGAGVSRAGGFDSAGFGGAGDSLVGSVGLSFGLGSLESAGFVSAGSVEDGVVPEPSLGEVPDADGSGGGCHQRPPETNPRSGQ